MIKSLRSVIFSGKEDSTTDQGAIRSSVVVLMVRLVSVILLIDITYAFINYFFLQVHFLNIPLTLDLNHYAIGLLMVIHILKTVLQIYFIGTIVMKWIGQIYFISSNHLVKREGVFNITEKSYDLKNIRSVTVHQSILGKLFHFGDVFVETSASGGYMEKVVLVSVNNPQKYEHSLQHSF